MTEMVSRPNWLRIRHKPPPSPIPKAADETNQIAEQLAQMVAEMKRMNDLREARLQ